MITGSQILAYLALKNDGDWAKIYNAIASKQQMTSQEVFDGLNSLTTNYVTILDDHYPQILKTVFKPPLVLFYKGDLSILHDSKFNLGVVGSRENSERGAAITNEIVEKLDPKVVVISGLAVGVDAIAHQAAIRSRKKTVAVLGCGINLCYTKSNTEIYDEIVRNHLVISEYPELTEPKPDNFPFRNRIIACLSQAILVTEAKKRSGSLITVNFALQLGKDIMCVPTFPGENSGCNDLIKDGASLVENADDVMENIESIISKKVK